ncbi:OmpA family protein [Jannaschia sp. W003]|uniref:OmpA family protein n=1 Tax=Jannaschia sp. W003 TaxID=2867012 RepID=UPI0021A8A510|nr:OmpA family protein [Jannaschia sp. W003]UWQ22919.1 OmpA family protein [Jannaschia sp. W003]
MNTPLLRRAAPLAALALLAACSDPTGGRAPVAASFDDGAFGAATRGNHAAQIGAGAALTALDAKFAGSVPATITFAFNSAALDATARAVLDQQADFMRQFPEVRFSVYGHTDLVGSDSYNQALGQRRAEAAVAYLGRRGVDLSRLEALVSLGETRPVVPTTTPERANRRTVTRVGGFVDGDGLVLDGKYANLVYRAYVASAVPAAPPA